MGRYDDFPEREERNRNERFRDESARYENRQGSGGRYQQESQRDARYQGDERQYGDDRVESNWARGSGNTSGDSWMSGRRESSSGRFGDDRTGDMRSMGHRGKGPKGYERSDERLKELVCERLTDDDSIDASDVSVEVQDGRVTLEGTVESRRAKYDVEECAAQCGAQDIVNNLRIGTGSSTLGEGRNKSRSPSSAKEREGSTKGH
jgi:osmotically-inducible protein OsmY